MKKTKIVATIGPASESKETLRELITSGVNIVRLNFSHGTHEWHGHIIDVVRELSQELGLPVGILADLQGPRIRVGNAEKFEIAKGEIIFVSDRKTTEEKELVIDSPGVCANLQVGERILVEDGLMELKVVEKDGEILKAEVFNGGEIKPRKGINIPDTVVAFGAVTEKDEKDLEFVVRKEVDFVALSFVSNGGEIEATRTKMKNILGRESYLPQIVSKVERKEAIKNIDEIIEASDVVMVARGDLGIEMDESRVVIYQKEIIAKCLQAVKPVIVATQMLDSMISNPIPTRAEVSDVSNAVIDHTDAVMLSGESANGKYPIETVAMMNEIIGHTEASPFDDVEPGYLNRTNLSDYASTINSAYELANSSKAKAVVMFTKSGVTAKLMSNHRSGHLLLAATDNLKTYNQLAIIWGIRAYYFADIDGRGRAIDLAIEKAKEEGKLAAGDKIVVILGKIPNGKELAMVGIREVE
jgi:pyruvate kinase